MLEDDRKLYQYTPRSDVSLVVNDFPVLLLEVTSDPSKTDMHRMLLQAACLVRLGNALIDGPEFLMKAIYIDDDYVATEYTLFQLDNSVFISLIVE